MTSLGECVVRAAEAAWILVNGNSSCPSWRSMSATIWTMVNSSSTRRILAISTSLIECFPAGQETFRVANAGYIPFQDSHWPGVGPEQARLEPGQNLCHSQGCLGSL